MYITVMDPLLSTREVAERLNVSPNTVKKLWREGRLRGSRISERKLRFEAADVERFLAGSGSPEPPYRSAELSWCADNPSRLTELAGQWVVVEGRELVCHGLDPLAVLQHARQAGVAVPYIFFVESRPAGGALAGLL
ncbi:MAG: helix-turn-helix domain-containing protein [Armatimonadetes bacterium]|nr:helix-turn-helix domain-containing protein [Armatimonadota bacterium]